MDEKQFPSSHFRRTPVATHSPGQRHGPFESWRAEDPAVTVSDTHSLWRIAQGAESAEERLSKCSFTSLGSPGLLQCEAEHLTRKAINHRHEDARSIPATINHSAVCGPSPIPIAKSP